MSNIMSNIINILMNNVINKVINNKIYLASFSTLILFASTHLLAQPLTKTSGQTLTQASIQQPLPSLRANPYTIATMPDAVVFYQYSNKLPSVVNYFTAHSQQEIIDFYQEKYGSADSKELNRGRLTLYFSLEKTIIKVTISNQDGKQQVDIIVT